jgi:hypothetical protein
MAEEEGSPQSGVAREDDEQRAGPARSKETGEDAASREREGDRSAGGDGKTEDISDTPAPSIGPHSVVEREPVEVRLARHEQSEVDAMGKDKRRQVVGKTYGPTFARQAALYLAFLVVVAAIAFGVKLLVDHYDQPPQHFKAEAPWAQKHAPEIKPRPLQ